MRTGKNLCLLLMLAFAQTYCGNDKFKGATAGRESGSIRGSDLDVKFSDALDISKLPVNVDEANAGGPQPGTGSELNKTLDLSCEQSSEHSITVSPSSGADIVAPPQSRVAMNVKGRFCPTLSDNLTVLFIIDFSGSMGPNAPDENQKVFQPATGNDPRVNRSCGRLQAVEAVMAKFKPTDKVQVGTVTFATDIVETHSMAPMDQANFRSSRLSEAQKVDAFCSYIAPAADFANQEMAVKNPAVGAATNYEAAFNRAYEFLKNVKGRKAIYFITDGRPTASSGPDPLAAAKTAADKLKTVENLFFNAFFLQYKQSGLQEDKQGFANLVSTIGSMDRVVKAESAAQLAIEAGKDTAVSFDPKSIKASLTVVPYKPEADLKLLSFSQDPTNPKAWVFATEAFVLLGDKDKKVDQLIQVTAKASDGTMHSSKVKISYQQGP